MASRSRLLGYLKALGISPSVQTFDDRKLLQKLVFLIDRTVVETGFEFDWYLHGPYSPSLTKELYEIADQKNLEPDTLNSKELKTIEHLKRLLGEDIRSADKLELLASIEYLKGRTSGTPLSEDSAVQIIRRIKPYFSERDIRECWSKSLEIDKLAH